MLPPDAPIVTNENYFSVPNNMYYMGSSQYKAFMRCEAGALAEARGERSRPSTTALLVGGYVDAHFEGTLDIFKAQHPEIYSKTGKTAGQLKSEYREANEIIARLESDRLFMLLMSGKKQVIKTGEIAGVPFKTKIDSYLNAAQCATIVNEFPGAEDALAFSNGAIVDGKIMRDMQTVYSVAEGRRVSFIEAWGYDYQGAIYHAIEGNDLPFILAVGTKEDTTDLEALFINYNDLAAKLEEVKFFAPRFQAIKKGEIEPTSCGTCDYCKSKKKLHSIIDYRRMHNAE